LSPSRTFEACQRSTRAEGPLFSSLRPLGGVGKPGWGTVRKYVSSSSDGYGEIEWGTVPVEREAEMVEYRVPGKTV